MKVSSHKTPRFASGAARRRPLGKGGIGVGRGPALQGLSERMHRANRMHNDASALKGMSPNQY